MEFKVGDRVRTISKEDNCSEKPVGYEFTVAEIYKSTQCWYREEIGQSYGVAGRSLELVSTKDMTSLNVGDTIKNIQPNGTNTPNGGKVGTVTKVYDSGRSVEVRYKDGSEGVCRESGRYYEVIKKTFMSSLIEKAVLAITPEPQKSFRKAGITNGDGQLTDDGAKVFLSYLLSKNQNEFKTEVVDGILAEIKDSK